MIFELTAAGLFAALVPAGAVALRGDPVRRAVGLQLAGTVLALLLLALAQALGQPTFQDLAVALAVVSYGGGLVFARFLARWL